MEYSREALLHLIALQEKDSSLDLLQARMAEIPVQIKELRDALEGEKAHLEAVKVQIITIEKRKKEKELDLGQKEESIKKHQKDLNQIKTNEAFKALQHEIDGAKAEGSAIETQILECMEQLDACRREEKAALAEFKALEAKAGAEIGVLESRLKELQARHDGEKGVRDEAAAAVSPDIMKIYMYLRGRGKLDALVAVRHDSCGACQMILSPNKIVEATKLKAPVYCESCQRILYRPEALVPKVKTEAPGNHSETAGGPLPAAQGLQGSAREGEELPNSTERGAC